jgi:hypothetical protein
MQLLLLSPILFDDSIDSILMRRIALILQRMGVKVRVVASWGRLAGTFAPFVDCKVTPAYRSRTRWRLASLLGTSPSGAEFPGYVSSAVQQGRGWHSIEPFDCILSRYVPWEAHEAAARLAPELRVPWISMYHDPFPTYFLPPSRAYSGMLSHPVRTRIMRKMAKRFLSAADAWVFPSERMGRYMSERVSREFKIKAKPTFALVHPGPFDTELPIPVPETKFVVRYIGTVGWGRDFRGFLGAWAQFISLEPKRSNNCYMEIIGSSYRVSQITRLFARNWPPDIETQMKIAGVEATVAFQSTRVTPDKALQLTANSTVALHVDADFHENIYLAGKLAELATLGKKVIALTPNPSACRDYLAMDPNVTCIDPNDESQILGSLTKNYNKWLNDPRTFYENRGAKITAFSEGSIRAQIEAILAVVRKSS